MKTKITPKLEITAKTDLLEELRKLPLVAAHVEVESATKIRQAIILADANFADYGVNRRDRLGSTINVSVLSSDDDGDNPVEYTEYTIKHGSERWALVDIRVGGINNRDIYGYTHLKASRWSVGIAAMKDMLATTQDNENEDAGYLALRVEEIPDEISESFRLLVEGE